MLRKFKIRARPAKCSTANSLGWVHSERQTTGALVHDATRCEAFSIRGDPQNSRETARICSSSRRWRHPTTNHRCSLSLRNFGNHHTMLVGKHFSSGFHCEGDDEQANPKCNRCERNRLAESAHSAD